jgi:hypothetical protein
VLLSGCVTQSYLANSLLFTVQTEREMCNYLFDWKLTVNNPILKNISVFSYNTEMWSTEWIYRAAIKRSDQPIWKAALYSFPIKLDWVRSKSLLSGCVTHGYQAYTMLSTAQDQPDGTRDVQLSTWVNRNSQWTTRFLAIIVYSPTVLKCEVQND